MANENETDPLALLGMAAAPTTEQAAAAPVQDLSVLNASVPKDETPKEVAEEKSFGFEQITEEADDLPALVRLGGGGKGRESQYDFKSLKAPVVSEDGKRKLSVLFVKFDGTGDADKMKRSVQSASTQQNRQNEGTEVYYETRTVQENGKFLGVKVYRTDARPAEAPKAEAAEAAAPQA